MAAGKTVILGQSDEIMYHVIDDQNINLERFLPNGSLINFSMLRELETKTRKLRSFSIKYVLQGTEHYTINNRKFNIKKGSYLLANSHAEGAIFIDSQEVVKGVCIDISPVVISEVVSRILRPDALIADPGLERFFLTEDFLENQYNSISTHLGKTMDRLGEHLSLSPYEEHVFTNEFYYELAEKVVMDHLPVYKQLQSVRAVKSETKKELLRRLMKGKEEMDCTFLENPSITLIAQNSGISEYHFMRLFKTVFGQSPYQYLLGKRLFAARELLKMRLSSVSGAAIQCGFSDHIVFSKAFKRYFGYNPSSLL